MNMNESMNQEWKNFRCSGLDGRSKISGNSDPNNTRTSEAANIPESKK